MFISALESGDERTVLHGLDGLIKGVVPQAGKTESKGRVGAFAEGSHQ
ncbi:hypothetical protein [Streptomyces sp. NPDC086838]